MGYECPVCGTPQRDGEHLANHLAFTAMLRGGDHEAWLDDHVEEWADESPESLAPAVTPHATEREFEDLEGTTEGHDHDHAPDFEDAVARQSGYGRDASASDGTEAVVEEARELTEAMLGLDEDEADSGKE